jgi:cellulose synthase/poly-beta-1,6-N-acetylglucosamine synthase-like glycosyltransferase
VLRIVTILVWALALGWLFSLALTFYGFARRRYLTTTPASLPAADEVPLVSILVPARNEEHRVLAESVASMLTQDYGHFEVVAVNDRSTDRTGQILNSMAQNDQRLRVIEGMELPPEWLGKPYAMHQALAESRGEWILATDADMIFEPACLRTIMERLQSLRGDAISLVPYCEAHTFWERVIIPVWTWVFLMYSIFFRISNPKSPGAAAIGGFFLIRRKVLETTGGYEALKDEVLEDMRLAEMIKRSGARLFIEHAPALIRTRMYSNFAEMWECNTKNWFSGMKFSVAFAGFCALSMYIMALVPPLVTLVSGVAMAAGGSANLWALFIPAVLSWLLQVLVLMMASKRSGVSAVYGLTAPLGLGLLYTMLLDSAVRVTSGTGVIWKGRRIYERSGVRPPRLNARMASAARDD